MSARERLSGGRSPILTCVSGLVSGAAPLPLTETEMHNYRFSVTVACICRNLVLGAVFVLGLELLELGHQRRRQIGTKLAAHRRQPLLLRFESAELTLSIPDDLRFTLPRLPEDTACFITGLLLRPRRALLRGLEQLVDERLPLLVASELPTDTLELALELGTDACELPVHRRLGVLEALGQHPLTLPRVPQLRLQPLELAVALPLDGYPLSRR